MHVISQAEALVEDTEIKVFKKEIAKYAFLVSLYQVC